MIKCGWKGELYYEYEKKYCNDYNTYLNVITNDD